MNQALVRVTNEGNEYVCYKIDRVLFTLLSIDEKISSVFFHISIIHVRYGDSSNYTSLQNVQK